MPNAQSPQPRAAQAPTSASSAKSTESPIAFVGGSVVPMDTERILHDQTVIVEAGRITTVGPRRDVTILDGTRAIDARGTYILPGLCEMHGHLPGRSHWAPARWRDDVLFLYLAAGITTVRGMIGNAGHLTLRDSIAKGEVLGPRLFVSSPPLGGHAVHSPEQATQLVQKLASQGFDHLKVHEGLTPQTFEALAAAARERGIQFAGHVPDEVGFRRAIEAGQRTVDHLDNMFDAVDGDPAQIAELVTLLQKHRAWVVPTEVLWRDVVLGLADPDQLAAKRPEVRYVPRALANQWRSEVQQRARRASPRAGAEARAAFRSSLIIAIARAEWPDGGGLLVGTDSPQTYSVPGFSIHHELRAMQDAGLRPFEVLEAATRRVAEFFDELQDAGTIAAGKRADFIVLRGNPLEDVANVERIDGVMAHGRWLDRAEIEQQLAAIQGAHSSKD